MKNYTYSGWKLNGFIALILNLALVGAAIYAITVLATKFLSAGHLHCLSYLFSAQSL